MGACIKSEARVVARCNPFKLNSVKEWTVKPGTRVSRVIRQMELPRGCVVKALLNARPLTEDEFRSKRVWEGDLLNLRVVPANKDIARQGAGLAIGAGALGLLWSLNRSDSKDAEQSVLQNNTLAPPPDPRPEPILEPVDGIGGYKDTILPQITGITNRKNNYGPYPRVYGTRKIYPVIVGDPFVVLEGLDQYLYAAFTLGYGELDISDIKIGDKAITAFDGSVTEIRYGTPSDTPLTLYVSDVAPLAVNETLSEVKYYERRAAQDADKISIDFQFPNGAYRIDANNGNHLNCGFIFNVDYRPVGSSGAWTTGGQAVFTLNTTLSIRQNYTINVTRGQYDVRIQPLQPQGDGISTINTVNWITLTAIKNQSPINPVKDVNGNLVPMAYLAVKIKASQLANGQLEELSCLAKSKLQTYNGSAWVTASLTNNPAWVFADMLCGGFFGGQIARSKLDGAKLKEWADYCDSKGFTFNHIYDTFVTIQEALKDTCSAGRATVNAPDGKVGVIIEKERSTIVQMFNPANTDNFRGRRLYPEAPHAIRVRYVTSTLAGPWETAERIVFDDGYNETNAYKYETLDTVGVTDANQAYKMGRYYLAASCLRPESYSFDCDWQHLVCNRGDLIRLNYDVSFHGLKGALITGVTLDGSGNMTGITLDNAVTMDGTSQFGIRVRQADNTYIAKQVQSVAGDTYSLIFTTAIPAATAVKPAKNDLVSFGFLNQESVEALVESIEYNLQDLTARLTCVDYSPGIYTADTGTIPAFAPQISTLRPLATVVPVPVVTSVRSDEAVLNRETDGSLTTRIQISLAPVTDPTVTTVEYQYKLTTGTWDGASQGNTAVGNAVYVTGVQDGQTYDVRLRNRTAGGKASDWTPVNGHYVIGKTTPPPAVPELLYTISPNPLVYWRYDSVVGVNVPLDFAGFRVKFQFGDNRTWANANLVADYLAATQINLSQFPGGLITIMVKALDVAGNESTNAAVLVRNFGDYETQNIVVTSEEAPAFSGTKTNCSVVSSVLKANDTGGSFWSGNDNNPFWSGNDSALFYTISYMQATYEWSYTPSYDVVEPFNMALQYQIAAEGYTLEYKTRGNSTFWNAASGADNNPFWSGNDSALFWAPDPGYAVWPGQLQGSNQTHDFRLTLFASATTQGAVSELALLLDVQDIQEFLNDVVISDAVAGVRLPITNSYRKVDFVNLTLEQDASHTDARTLEIIDKSTAGPLIKAYDSTHTPCTAKFDALVQGH